MKLEIAKSSTWPRLRKYVEWEGGLEENHENIYISEMNRRGYKKKEFLEVGSKQGEISVTGTEI